MAFRSIMIASPDGSGALEFTHNKVKLPRAYPEFVRSNQNKSYQMARPMTGGPGRRIWKSVGSDLNKDNIQFVLHNLTWAEIQQIRTWYSTAPSVVLFSQDGGTTKVFAVFTEDPLTPLSYDFNEDPDTGLPYQSYLNISLAVLQTADEEFDFEEEP